MMTRYNIFICLSMLKKTLLKKSALLTLFLSCNLSFSSVSQATIVEFKTSQGDFKVNLFDQTTPVTVDNFLSYVNDLHYSDSVVHRVSPDFVVQGGGYSFSGDWPLTALNPNPAIQNEPVYSNVKGTIAMAKKGGNSDSATNQWFFNLNDNSSNLDLQNGGFTVFGQVIGDGMGVIEKIAQLELCNNGSLAGIPVVDYSSDDCTNKTVPGVENFVTIEQIVIIDSSEVTDADLTPKKNTLITQPVEPAPSPSSGGSLGWLSLGLLALVRSTRQLFKHK